MIHRIFGTSMRPSAFANGNDGVFVGGTLPWKYFNEAVGFRQRKWAKSRRFRSQPLTSMRPSAFANGNLGESPFYLPMVQYFNEAVGFRQRKSAAALPVCS